MLLKEICILKDKSEMVLEILAKHHGGGDTNKATIQFQYREANDTIQVGRNAKKATSYLGFYKTKGNR
ncbi:hypothetical protein J3459_008378 [Metarhizium acridum]|nr:hypothetical protein J3459_008378 [Metarhizium acridum]